MIACLRPFLNKEITGAYHYLYCYLIGYPPWSEWVENYLTFRDELEFRPEHDRYTVVKYKFWISKK